MKMFAFIVMVLCFSAILRQSNANWSAQYRPLPGQSFSWIDGLFDFVLIIIEAMFMYCAYMTFQSL